MSTSVGRQAEDAAAEYLKNNGFKILEQNWRTRWCEIDIVAQKHGRVFFVEVKYRQSDDFGGGLEYITPKKLKQMQFAAEFWVSEHDWSGDYALSVVEITGSGLKVTNHLQDL
jgi:uncharacterized protein (TIGR00252 family)